MPRSHAALSRFVACGVLLCGGASVALSTAGRAPGLSTIDVPGASFTSATGINPQGDIVGQYDDEAGRRHGFLLVDGAFTTIDYPNAVSTGAFGINPQGDIVGNYQGRVATDPRLSSESRHFFDHRLPWLERHPRAGHQRHGRCGR